MAAKDGAGAVHAAVALMRAHPDLAQVQLACCRTIANAHCMTQGVFMRRRGVFKVVVAAMRRHVGVVDLQLQGCLALGQLARNNRANQRAIRKVTGAFDVVAVAMQRHEAVAGVQRWGCWTLGHLAFNNVANKRAIGRVVGVFDAIVRAMRRHEGVAEVQRQACWALGQLAYNARGNQRAIGNVKGVFDILVLAMRRHGLVAEVQWDGCRALGQLASNYDRNQSAIGSVRGVFDLIVASMRRHQGVAEVQRWGCWALGQLACDNHANKRAIGSVPGVFDVIVGAMRRHEGVAEVQHVATATLCHLVTHSAGGFMPLLLGWLPWFNESSADAETAARNATRLTAVKGIKEALRGSTHRDAPTVLDAMWRAEEAKRCAADAERRAADAEQRVAVAERRASQASMLAEDETKRANDEAKRADEAEGRAAREKQRADRAEAPPGPTPATARIAVVIANARYQGDEPPLPRCAADGEAMERTLRARGFDVHPLRDATSLSLERALTDFGCLARDTPGCIAVWYFTGHGFEAGDGDLNLVPVDGAAAVGGHPMTLRRLEKRLHEYTAGQESTIIIILDCCRTSDDNATLKSGSGRHGARWTHAAANLRNERYLSQYLVAHACESGTAARADAEGAGLSPFTDALVPPLSEGVPLQVALTHATKVVVQQTGNTQRPCYRSSLTTTPLVL